MKLGAVESVASIGVRHIDDVALNVLVSHKPRAAAKAKPLALPHGVEPVALVLANDLARFALYHLAFALAEQHAQVVVVVNLAKEADALAVAAVGRCQVFAVGNVAHLVLEQMSDGEAELLCLHIGQLRQKVGLVLYGVGGRCQVELAVGVVVGLGIVAGGNVVVGIASLLLKGAKLDEAVAHYIGVGREAALDTLHHIGCDAVVVFLLQVDNVELQSVAFGSECGEFDVLLGSAGCAFALHANLYVKKVGLDALLTQQVAGHGAVNAARNQKCVFFVCLHIM